MQYEVGDIVKLKKKHPCGSFEWEILRVGADFRLKCLGCEHQVMMERKLVEKSVKEIRKTCYDYAGRRRFSGFCRKRFCVIQRTFVW